MRSKEMRRGHTVPFFVEIKEYMISKDIVNQLIEDYLTGSDFYLVDLVLTPDQRISIEIDAWKGVSIEDCVQLNRYLVERLSPAIEDYEVEVSSAGITEPFKVLRQYQKNIGKEVEVLTREGKKLTGILTEATPEVFTLKAEKKVKEEGSRRKTIVEELLTFNYTAIKTTKMIIRFK